MYKGFDSGSMYSIYNEETFDSQSDTDLDWNFQTPQAMDGGVGGYIQKMHELVLQIGLLHLWLKDTVKLLQTSLWY